MPAGPLSRFWLSTGGRCFSYLSPGDRKPRLLKVGTGAVRSPVRGNRGADQSQHRGRSGPAGEPTKASCGADQASQGILTPPVPRPEPSGCRPERAEGSHPRSHAPERRVARLTCSHRPTAPPPRPHRPRRTAPGSLPDRGSVPRSATTATTAVLPEPTLGSHHLRTSRRCGGTVEACPPNR